MNSHETPGQPSPLGTKVTPDGVLGIEMSRLARSCKDWHALLEICAIYQTLLLDTDGIYDPSDHNDRLLLGLKGTMSEAELHLLTNRMYRGLCNKAERGEVLNHAPIGYVRTLTDNFVIDPDESVQSVVRSIFDRFAKWGSISGLLKSLVRDKVQIPVRPHFGDDRGELQWRRAQSRDSAEHVASSDLCRCLPAIVALCSSTENE